MKKSPILYVDDEASNLVVFKSAFRRDYQIFTAQSGEEGIQILKQEYIELIITDQRMPEMTGIEFLHKIIPDYPDIIRIILTGYSDVEAIIQAINNGGVYQYVRKPWNRDEFKVIIDHGLETYSLKNENQRLVHKLEDYARNLEDKVSRRTQELDLKNQKLKHQKESIESSILYARRIQEAMLPPLQKIQNVIPESFVFLKPCDVVSGDFYWFTETETKPIYQKINDFELNQKILSGFENEKIVIAAVDCTGHGVPGAFMSMMGDSYLNQIINQQNIAQADEILHYLNKNIQIALKQPESGNRDGMEIALCVIDLEANELTFAGAKNPLIYIENDELVEIKGSIAPIGGEFPTDIPREYIAHTIEIKPSRTFYIFSDGFQDQFGGAKGKKFMKGHFKALLLEIHQKPMQEQLQIIQQTLSDWKGDYPQIDDILIIGFRFN